MLVRERVQPDADFFIARWSEPGDAGHALYHRVNGYFICKINGDGTPGNASHGDRPGWVNSALFAVLTPDEAEAAFTVSMLNPLAWDSFAQQLFNDGRTIT